MTSCIVRARTIEEFGKLMEVKVAEILNKGGKIVQMKTAKIEQKKLFGKKAETEFECILIMQ